MNFHFLESTHYLYKCKLKVSWSLNKEHIPQLTNIEFKLKFLLYFACALLIHISIIFEFHREHLQNTGLY